MMDQNFFDDQALRLLKAFFKVRDQESREQLIRLIESAEAGTVIKGADRNTAARLAAGDNKVVVLQRPKNPFS